MTFPSHPPIATLPQVIGRNVRNLRRHYGWTQEEVASACRAAGLKWGYRRVLELEAGEVAAGLPTLLRLVAALDTLIPPEEAPITFIQLLSTSSEVRLGGEDTETVPGSLVLQILQGEPGRLLQPHLRHYEPPAEPNYGDAPTSRDGLTRAEVRMARSLGLTGAAFMDLCRSLWGHGLEAERNRREREEGGGPLNAGGRRWITSGLREELEYARELQHLENQPELPPEGRVGPPVERDR